MEVTISAADAHKVFLYLFGKSPPASQIDLNDRRFAQGLIISAAQASVTFGIIDKVKAKVLTPAPKPLTLIFTIVKAVLDAQKKMPKSTADAMNTEMYATILKAQAWANRSHLEIRMQTGETDGYSLPDTAFAYL